MTAVLVVLITILAMLLPFGILVAVFVHLQNQQREQAALWARFGARHGLYVQPSGVRGVLQGVPVAVLHEVRGSGKNRVTYTVARAQLSPALDLGLSLRRSQMGDGLLESLGMLAPDVLVGDAAFDRNFHVSGHEVARVAALLGPELRLALLGIGFGAIYVDDLGVRVERRGFVDEAFAEWSLATVLWFAQALQAAATRVPPAPLAVPYLSAFDQAARALGLGYRATPPALGGALDGVQVWAQLTRQGPSQLGCDLYAQHPSQLGLGLELRPRRGTAFPFFSSPDIELGDPRFDDRFDVHGRDPEGVRAVLDAEIRARIDALRDRGAVLVDDVGVRLSMLGAPDPRALVPTLRAVRDLSAALAERASGAHAGGRRGAYR